MPDDYLDGVANEAMKRTLPKKSHNNQPSQLQGRKLPSHKRSKREQAIPREEQALAPYGRERIHALEESNRTLRRELELLQFQSLVLERVNDAVIAMDEQQRITYMNSAAERLSLVTADEACGQHVEQVFHYEWLRPEDERTATQALKRDDAWQGENLLVRRDGSLLHVETVVSTLQNDAGCAIGLLAVIRDITRRTRAEDSMRQSAQRKEFLLRLTDALDQVKTWKDVQSTACQLLGEYLNADHVHYAEYDPNTKLTFVASDYFKEGMTSLAGRHPYANFLRASPFIFGDLEQGRTEVIEDIETSDRLTETVRATSRQNGVRAWVAVPLLRSGQLAWSLSVLSNTTRQWTQDEIALIEDVAHRTWDAVQRAKAEAALHKGYVAMQQQVRNRTAQLASVNQERKSLLQRLLISQEEERTRLSRELHDQVGQELTALAIRLSLLETELGEAQTVQPLVKELGDLLLQTTQTVRALAADLRPPALDMLGLPAAMKRYVRDWGARFKIEVEFQCFGFEAARLPTEVETELYRIVQEALTNVLKHARASHVEVLLESRGDEVTTIIADDGVGFGERAQTDGEEYSRLGLLGMRERALLVGGRLDIQSARGKGTRVQVRIPLNGSDSIAEGGPLPLGDHTPTALPENEHLPLRSKLQREVEVSRRLMARSVELHQQTGHLFSLSKENVEHWCRMRGELTSPS